MMGSLGAVLEAACHNMIHQKKEVYKNKDMGSWKQVTHHKTGQVIHD